MNITATQLQTQHNALIDALKRGESVTLSYHGQPLGIVDPVCSGEDEDSQIEAMSHSVEMDDALIAATAIKYDEDICTGNIKHFEPVKGIKLHRYIP